MSPSRSGYRRATTAATRGISNEKEARIGGKAIFRSRRTPYRWTQNLFMTTISTSDPQDPPQSRRRTVRYPAVTHRDAHTNFHSRVHRQVHRHTTSQRTQTGQRHEQRELYSVFTGTMRVLRLTCACLQTEARCVPLAADWRQRSRLPRWQLGVVLATRWQTATSGREAEGFEACAHAVPRRSTCKRVRCRVQKA